MILTTWYQEAMKQTKINPQQYHPLGPSTKKAHYVSYTSSYLKTVILIQLQILDSIMSFRAHMIEKIRGLIGIYYQLQNNGAALLRCLSHGHAFLDPDLDKV